MRQLHTHWIKSLRDFSEIRLLSTSCSQNGGKAKKKVRVTQENGFFGAGSTFYSFLPLSMAF